MYNLFVMINIKISIRKIIRCRWWWWWWWAMHESFTWWVSHSLTQQWSRQPDTWGPLPCAFLLLPRSLLISTPKPKLNKQNTFFSNFYAFPHITSHYLLPHGQRTRTTSPWWPEQPPPPPPPTFQILYPFSFS